MKRHSMKPNRQNISLWQELHDKVARLSLLRSFGFRRSLSVEFSYTVKYTYAGQI